MLPSSPPLEYPGNVLSLGYLTGAFGIRGELRFRPHNPDSDILDKGLEVFVRLYQKRTANPFIIQSVRDTGKGPLVTLKGVQNRTQAELYRHAEIFVHEDLLPELEDEEYYYFQLEGFAVVSTEDEEIGKVKEVTDNPAHPHLIVQHSKTKKEVMIPMVEAFVKEIDYDQKHILVEVWPGLFGDEE